VRGQSPVTPFTAVIGKKDATFCSTTSTRCAPTFHHERLPAYDLEVATVGYHIVFDASKNGSQLAIWMLAPIFALVFAAIGWGMRDSGDRTLHQKGTLFVVISSCAFALSLVLVGTNIAEYHRASNSLKRQDYRVAEGVITDFVPMPHQGHAIESFKVGGSSFQYGSGWGSITFNSEWNHGSIHDGVHARISYKDDEILRVEVR
jgi:hypothetical protein